ncbi:GNAT family N-acetyltransferase [Aquitalea magnusonii]|uniref:GNAT family N-acetyltransferase n=1 Tax=Aquitalea magnusonii TaxID=332411 RepID=UPI00195A00BA|nr:GNAT family N-acetyltransferase [Aquitalea magnusonii]
MNNWLAQMANQHQAKGFARTFVAVDSAVPDKILGYYALASAHIMSESLADNHKLPRIIPAVRLGRLAIDRRVQGIGMGAALLVDALTRIRDDIAPTIGVHSVFVDAVNEHAANFYQKFGFTRSPGNPLLLALPIASIPLP